MTDEQKYCSLLKEIGQIIGQKNTQISAIEFENGHLRRKLEEAEKQIESIKNQNADEQ